MSQPPRISASFLLSLALLSGRLTGLLRELGLASIFGVTRSADLAVLLLTLPDLLVNLLISGGLSAALVPRFSALDPLQAMALFRRASAAVLVLFALAGVILVIWPEGMFFLLAPGLDAPSSASRLGLIAVAVALPLTGVAGVAGAYLNARQRFMVVGCGTLFFNGGVLASLFFARSSAQPLVLLSCGIVAGAGLRWAAQMLILPRGVWHTTAHGKLIDGPLAKAFILATLGSSLTLLAPIIVRAMASTLGSGAIASFNYAQKLVELPVTILITSISTVALSRLSVLHGQGKPEDARISATRDIQYALLVGLAVMFIGIWFADSIVQVIFSRGKIDPTALARISQLTKIAMLGIPWVAIGSMATAFLNASKRIHLVFNVTVASLLLLPVLAVPGLILKSESVLMLSVVGFQAATALWLARLAQLRLFGRNAVFSRLTWPHFLAVLAVAAACALTDWMLHTNNPWIRLGLATVGFAVTMGLPVRYFVKFPRQLPRKFNT